jgi:hypothetical protein
VEADVSALPLVHDVLDAQLLDKRQVKIGRVDELLLELREGEPPRVATILVGGPVRAERVGRWMTWLRRTLHAAFGRRDDCISCIPFDAVRCIADTIDVDIDGHTLPSEHTERWLAEHVVSHLPGGRGEHK